MAESNERPRDLFAAIVVSGIALGAGCGDSSVPDDAGAMLADASMDADSTRVDAAVDAGGPDDAGMLDDAGEDAMVIIL